MGSYCIAKDFKYLSDDILDHLRRLTLLSVWPRFFMNMQLLGKSKYVYGF